VAGVDIGIVGAPVDLGADRRGVDMGTSAIRYAGLEAQLRAIGHNVRDFGNVAAPPAESTERAPSELKYLEPIVAMAADLDRCVSAILEAGYFPLTLGGDHSASLGSVAAVSRSRRLGILWLDAHGDFNVPSTSPSGNIHGMVLSALAGRGDQRLVQLGGHHPKVAAQNIALIGVRDLDAGERALLHESGVHVFSMYEIDRLGLNAVLGAAIEQIATGVDGIHLSLDLDVVDPLQAPGVGTPVLGGLSYRETHLAMELLAETGTLVSMDVVEVNPILDNRNETARLAMQFTLSALGKRIL
jgi:arginase